MLNQAGAPKRAQPLPPLTIAGRILQDDEVAIRVVARRVETVLSALETLEKAFPGVVRSGILPNRFEEGYRGYAFAKVEGSHLGRR